MNAHVPKPRNQKLSCRVNLRNIVVSPSDWRSSHAVTRRVMQMQIRFGRDFNAAEARARIRAAIGHKPLAGEKVIELSEVWIECHEVCSGEERLASRFVRQ